MHSSASPAANSHPWTRDLLLLALSLALWFGLFLGSRPLNNPDEGRYTEIPREMAATGDYVTPRLNGVKYFEKPPLQYWLSALTFEVTGVNEWSARLWGAVFALAGGLLTYAAARALHGRAAGWWSAIVLSTTLLYYGLSRVILLDLMVAVTIAGALFAFLLGVRAPAGGRRRALFWTFYACMALAVLTKGLIGFVLPCGVAFLWLLIFNQWRSLRPCHPFSGSLILLAIAAPWHVFAALRNPGADGAVWPGYARGLELHHAGQDPGWLWFYFVREHFLRFTTTEHGRFEPWWFFPPVIVAGLFPWVVFAWPALRRSLAGGWRARAASPEAWFLVTWIVVITAFFSKSQSKLVPYILPVFPPAAVLLGRYLAEAWESRAAGRLRPGLLVFAGLALVLALAAALTPLPDRHAAIADGLLPWRFCLGGGFLLGSIAIFWRLRRDDARGALAALVACCALCFAAANLVAAHFDTRSTREIARALLPRLRPEDAVFIVKDYAQDLPVYLGREVGVVGYRGELAYGIDAEPKLTGDRFISTEDFLRRWRGDGVVYALVRANHEDKLFASEAATPRTLVARSAKHILVVNRSQ